MAESMAAITSPKSRMDLARILRANENCIVTTLNYLGELYGLNIDKKSKLEVMLRRIRDTIRLSEQCEREYLSVYEILFNRIRENTVFR